MTTSMYTLPAGPASAAEAVLVIYRAWHLIDLEQCSSSSYSYLNDLLYDSTTSALLFRLKGEGFGRRGCCCESSRFDIN